MNRKLREFADSLTTCPSCGHACRVVGTQYEPVHLLADTPSVEPAGLDVERLARALHNNPSHEWGVDDAGDHHPDSTWCEEAERQQAAAIAAELAFLPTQASDSPEKT